MNKNVLKIIDLNGEMTVDSREVAEIIEVKHKHLLDKIRNYIDVLDGREFGSHQFFIPSEYKNSQNKVQPCYMLTKKGCEMIANKLTGEKGVLFTALYVETFNEMQNQINLKVDSYMIDNPIDRAKRWIEEETERQNLRIENKNLTEEVMYKEDTILGLLNDIDLTDKRRRITEIIRHKHCKYSERYNALYKEFEMKYKVDLNRRMNSVKSQNVKPKYKNKMDYIDRDLNMIPQLYEICCKLFENDVKELVDEMYSANVN